MLYFITSNQHKIFLAKKNLTPLGIHVASKSFEISEIQSDNDKEIAMKKAIDAYELFQHPLFVSDDSWYIPALQGFPGAYMKYMNQWFTADDFLRLVAPYKDRTIILRQTLCFTNGNETKIFTQDNKGYLLLNPFGKDLPILQIATFTKTGESVAQCIEEGKNPIDITDIWQDFGKWYLLRNNS